MNNYTYKKEIRPGDVFIVNLPRTKGYCLNGRHKSIIIKRFGSTVQVVPISTNRQNIHYGEIPLDPGKCGVNRSSKIKIGQLTSVSIDAIERYVGRADESTLKSIKNFIKEEIVDSIN